MSADPSAQPAPRTERGALWFGLALVALTLLAYAPAIHADFIWNDSDYVTAPALQSVDGLRRIWTEVGATEQYYPLLHSAFWVEHRLWGDSPVGYHLVNIVLHAGAAWLFALLLRRLGVRGARLAALVFALHPVCVESVAWISEQKNTLSLVFFLAAAVAYLRFDQDRDPLPVGRTVPGEPRPVERSAGSIWLLRLGADASPDRGCSVKYYRLATVLFIGALLSKTTTATLPAVLLVIVWWRRGRLEWRRDVVPLLPWFILGAAFGLFSAWVEKHVIGAAGSEFALSFVERGLLAGRIVWFYLGKLLLPIDLIFIYPRWSIDAGVPWQWLFPLALIVLVVALWLLRQRTRAPLAVLLLFAGSLFPVLGFFNVYAFMFSFVADHWQYLPCLAVIAFVGAGLARMPRVVSALLIAGLGVLTWQQSHLYADMDTFYRTTLARNPDCWMAENNLGSLRHLAGHDDEAIAHYEKALHLKPDSSKAHTNLGNILRDHHRLSEALPHFEAAVQIEPDASVYQDNLAGALRESGRAREAVPHHREALRLDPTYSAAHNNYGVTLRELGRADEAVVEFEQAVQFDPNSAPAHLNLMLSFWQAGHVAEAEAEYRIARRLNPAIPEVDFSIGAPK